MVPILYIQLYSLERQRTQHKVQMKEGMKKEREREKETEINIK